MAPPNIPSISLHPLVRADGSATFTSSYPPRTMVIAAVHAPLEPPPARREEQSASATLEVHIRPAHGLTAPRFRRLEAVLTSLLRAVVAVDVLPRALVRITLQVTEEGKLSTDSHADRSGLPGIASFADALLIPVLVNAAFLALLDGAVPLRTSVVAGLGIVLDAGTVVVDPEVRDLQAARSVHALVFNRNGDTLLDESVGPFGIDEWGDVVEKVKTVCLIAMADGKGDQDMVLDDGSAGVPWLRATVEEKVLEAGSWRTAV